MTTGKSGFDRPTNVIEPRDVVIADDADHLGVAFQEVRDDLDRWAATLAGADLDAWRAGRLRVTIQMAFWMDGGTPRSTIVAQAGPG